MCLNAYEKIKKSLSDSCRGFKYQVTNLSDEQAIYERMENGMGKGGYGLYFIKNYPVKNRLESQVSMTEYSFENGLFFLDSQITYEDQFGNPHTLRQFTLTSDYTKEPFVQVVYEQNKKTYRQLLTKTVPKDSLFANSKKDVSIETVKINLNGTCGSSFTQYTDLHTNQLIKEDYEQGYGFYDEYVSKEQEYSLMVKCGCLSRKLEILYDGENDPNPIYAQFSDKYKVEHVNYDSNNSKDVKQIVRLLNAEIGWITGKINSLVREYVRESNGKQKTIGTIPQE